MPEGIKTYATANGTLVNVPESKVDTFLELFPDSEEYIGIKDDKGEEGYLSAKEFGSYRAQNPNIRPLSGDYQSYFNDIYSGSSKPQLPSIVKQQFPALDKVNDLAGPRQVVKPANVADRSTIQQPFPVPTEQEFEEANAKLKAELAAKEAKNSLKGNFLSNQFEKSKNDTYDISEGVKVAGQNAWGAITEIPDLVTKELADRFSGPKPGDFAYGLGYDPEKAKQDPVTKTAQKIADDANTRIEQHALKLQEASAGNEGWAYAGASIPTLFELGAATFSRSPELTKLVIDKMAATAYLKAGVAYDNHIKETGEQPDGMRKTAYQVANALIFKVNFTALSKGLSPKYAKDLTQGLTNKLFGGNTAQQVTNATELIGKAVEGSPLSKKLLNDVVHGAGIGTAFGVSQDIADRVLMGQDRTFGESVKSIAESAASMAAFSGILSPIGLFAQKAVNIERWEKSKDPIIFTADAKGNPVEIFRDGTGRTADGKVIEVTPEMHSKAFAVPYSVIEKTKTELKSGIEPTPKEREVTQYNVEMFANGVSDGKGNINIITLADGTKLYLKRIEGENAIVFDENANKLTIPVKDIANTEYRTVNEMVNERMAEWDRLNTKQPEQQLLTGAEPKQTGEPPIQPDPVTELQNKISPVINENGTHIVTNAHVDGKPYFIKSGVLLDQDGKPELDSIDPSTPPILVDSEGNITNIPFTDFDPTTWESSPAQTIVENKQAEIVAQQEQEAIQEQAQEQVQEQIQQEQAQQPQTLEIGKKKFSFVEQGEEDIYDLSQSKDPQGDINTLNEYLNSKGYKAFPQAETVVIPPANKYEQPTQKQVITKAIVRPYKPMSEIQLPTQQRMADIMSTPTEGATTTPTPAAAQITPEQIAQQEQQMQQVQEMEQKFADAEAQDLTKIKRKGLFLSKEGIMRSSVEAQTPEEAILQFFAAGNKIPKEDFIALTGWGNKNVKRVHGVTELNQYRWLWGIKDAVPVDKIPNVMGSQVLSDYLEQSGGNAIQNLVQSAIMSHSTRESMINELAIMQASKAGQDIDPEALAEEYYAKLEEQALESKAEEDEIYNHILSTIVNELNGEIPANLFNFEENEQIETGGSLQTAGETDSEINAGNRNDEVGSTADGETEPQQSKEVNETGINQDESTGEEVTPERFHNLTPATTFEQFETNVSEILKQYSGRAMGSIQLESYLYQYKDTFGKEYLDKYGITTRDELKTFADKLQTKLRAGKGKERSEALKQIQEEKTTNIISEIEKMALEANAEMQKQIDATEVLNIPTNQKVSQSELDTQELDSYISEQSHNTKPTEKQKETGIYDKARISLQGYNITIETLKGTDRSGVDSNGKAWSITMNNHYGELDGTKGYDGDAIDVFVGPNPKQGHIFVIDQLSNNGAFDESKVMLGFDTAEQAKDAYMSNYEAGWQGFGSITPAGDSFKAWLYDGKKQRKPFAEYKETPEPVSVSGDEWERLISLNDQTVYPIESLNKWLSNWKSYYKKYKSGTINPYDIVSKQEGDTPEIVNARITEFYESNIKYLEQKIANNKLNSQPNKTETQTQTKDERHPKTKGLLNEQGSKTKYDINPERNSDHISVSSMRNYILPEYNLSPEIINLNAFVDDIKEFDPKDKFDKMQIDLGFTHEVKVSYPHSLGENGQYTSFVYKSYPSVKDIQSDLLEYYPTEIENLKGNELPYGGYAISSHNENIISELQKALDYNNTPSEPSEPTISKTKTVEPDKPKFAGEAVNEMSKPIEETISKYGWTANKLPDGTTQLVNRNGKHAATITQKGAKYVITDLSGTKLLTGNSDVVKGAEKVIKEYFYGKENGDNTILKHRRRKEEEIISPNLVALHNIQAGNIRNIEKIGGMITPSIAILEKETPYTDFGDITLIANKKLINPENYDVKIFKGDVYSPSVPRPEWEVNKGPYISWVNKIMSKTYDSYREIASTVQNVVDDFGSFGKALSRYEHESLKESEYNEMKKVYLIEKGIPINMPMKGYPVKIGFNFYINELTPDEKVQARELLNKFNKETKASSSDITDETKKAIYKLAGDIAYRESLSHYQSIEGLPEGFANSEAEEQRKKVMDNVNIHYFTDSLGYNLNNRQQLDTNKIDDAIQKSFKKNVKKAEYDEWLDNLIYSFQGRKYFERGNEKVPYTLENLIDATSGKTRGQEKGITFGMNRAKSYAIKQMKTVQDLHKHKKDLISKEEMSRIEKELQAEYFSVADKIKYGYNDQWGKLDDFGRSLADYYKGNSPSNALRKNGFKPDSYDIDNFKEYADKLANSPVDYFEAKIQRGVELSEFKYAIVPKTTDKDVIEILKSKGVKVKKYDTEQERTSIINELAEKDSQILFHKKPRFAGDLMQEMNAKRAIPSAVNTQTLQEPTLIPDGKAYETSQGNTIRYNTSEPTGQYGIKGQDNTSMDSDTGEFCAVERLLNEQKHIDLTGTTTIKSPDDVAFLFRHLEEAASENAFAVFIKPDKSYKVLYLSTGSTTGTVVDSKLIALAAKEFKAKSVTFVHNHPSGNLMTSEADVNLHKRVVNALKGICSVNPGIIINLDSGKYAEFGFDDYETKPVDYNKEASKVKVYQFDKQKLYTPSIERPHVTGSTDVAKVLSKIKRGTDKKYIILVLDRRNNVTRALLDNDISPKHLLPIIAKHGEAVIISGNIELEKSKLIEIKSQLQAADISFLDYIQVEPDSDIIKAYKSYADEGYFFEPETKYETGTVYESKPTFAGEAIEQILKSRQSEIGFYSPTEKALNAIQQTKGTPEQFKAMLLKNGAKQAEMDWMDFDGTFTGNSVTKAEIQEWIDENRIEVKEVVKGDIGNDRYIDREEAEDMFEMEHEVYGIDASGNESLIESYDDLDRYERFALDDNFPTTEPTKFSQYVLPGGENYKEILLTMPTDRSKIAQRRSELAAIDRERPLTEAEQVEYDNLQSKWKKKDDGTFISSHFDEPNIVAHIRINDRTDTQGRKVLFVEELQSDWAQKGKKEGFSERDSGKKFEPITELPDNYEVVKIRDAKITGEKQLPADATFIRHGGNTLVLIGREAVGEGWDEESAKENAIDNLYNPIYRIKDKNTGELVTPYTHSESEAKKYMLDNINRDAKVKFENAKHRLVPSMPFQKTDQWLNLAFRRMMRYSAENGYDAIAWTNGEQQAARYDLSKQVSGIYSVKKPSGKYSVVVKDLGFSVIDNLSKEYEANELEPMFGKDVAEKIINNSDNKTNLNPYKIEGENLAVGGTGMKAFYDSIVPNAANKLGKAFGAKVEEIQLNTQKLTKENTRVYLDPNNKSYKLMFGSEVVADMTKETGDGFSIEDRHSELVMLGNKYSKKFGLQPQQSLPITPQMRESVLGGVPLFHILGETGASNLDKAEEATTRLDNLRVAKEMEALMSEKEDTRGGVYNSSEYKTADKVRKLLKLRGIDKSFTASSTDFGNSMYFTVYGENPNTPLLKVRISDHSVSNKDRIFGEQHESAKSDPVRIANNIELAMFPERYNKIQTGARYYSKYNNEWITEPVENGKAWVKSYNSEITEKQLDNLNPNKTRIVSKEFVKVSKSNNNIYKVVLENLTEVGEIPTYKYERKEVAPELKSFTPQEIRLATGWERGVDGKWKYEIPDEEFTPKFIKQLSKSSDRYKDERTQEESGVVSDVINKNSEIIKAYPILKKTFVTINIHPDNKNTGHFIKGFPGDKNSFGRADEIMVKADSINKAQSIFIHELQHAIQDIEGFAVGGSPKMMAEKRNELNSAIDFYNEELAKANKEGNKELYDKLMDIKLERVKEIQKIEGDGFGNSYTSYGRLSGETEARNAQTRINFTPEQRRKQLLSETADVAPEDQIIIFDAIGISQLSVKPTHEEVKAHAEKTLAQLNSNTKMVIVDKAAELKTLYINEGASKQLLAQIDGVISNPYYDGFFDPTTRKIVIITSRVDSLEQTESIINHESVHATNRNFLGERRRDILNFFHEQYGEQNALEYLSEDYSDLQPFDMADEVIAYTVQDMIDNNTIPTENPLTYREIVDIVEGNTIIDNFTERLISTIYHETQTHKGTNGGIPVVPESDRSPMDGVRPDQTGQSREKGLADNGNIQREKPQFAGELLGEGSLGLLKSISLGKTKDMSEPTFQEIFQQRYFAIQDLKDKGVKRLHVNGDATVTVYHGTSVENWSKIQKEGFNGQTFFSVNKSGTQYGDSPIDVAKRKFGENGIVVEVKVDPRHVSSAAAGSELYAKNELIYKDGHFEEKQIPSTITINGTPRPTTNSKGQPIADSEDKIRNFYQWFSNSKVVDAQGRPLVVYRNDNSEIYTFDKKKQKDGLFGKGFFFTSNRERANQYGKIQHEHYLNGEVKVYGDIYKVTEPTQIKSATGNNGVFTPDNPNILKHSKGNGRNMKRIIGEKDYGDRFAEWIAENVHSVDLWQKEMLKDGIKGTKLFDVYQETRLRKGKIKGLVDKFDKGPFKTLEENLAKLIDTNKTPLAEIQKYIKAKSALERNDNEGISAISEDPADDWNRDNVTNIIQYFEAKTSPTEITELWDNIKDATDFGVDILFNKGIINKEALDKYKSRKYYVPLRGWEYNEANPNPESFYDYINNEGDGIYSQTYVKATIKAKGRTSEPGDPLPYIRQIAHSSIMSGVKNNIARTALNLFRMNAKTPEIGSYMYIKEPFKGNAHEAMRTRATAEKHEIVGYDNGDRFTLVLGDPHVAQAIKGENVLLQETAKFLGDSWMGKLTHFMKANFTGKNPNFFLNNFLFIDVPYAAITEGIRKEGESIQFAKQMLTGNPFKTIHRDITNNLNPLTKGEAIAAGLNSKASFKAAIDQYGESRIYDTMYEMWKDAGGPTGWMQLESFEKSANKINNEVKRIQAKEAGPVKELSKLSTKDKFLYNYPLRKGAELMEYVMAMSEQSSRFAVFVSRKMAGQSTQQAALASKEATVDFDRTGQAGTVFNQLFAFFKPTVSATYGVYKMAKDNKEKFGYALGSFFALGVIQAILAYMSMPEDESGESQYDNLHDYEILNNLIIPRFWDEKAYKEAKYVKIPMPQFFRAIFALGVTSTQVAMGKRDAIDFATTNLGNLVSAMTPFNLSGDDPARVLVPTSIVPAYDIAVNKAFTGKQVYKEQFTKSLEERVPHSQEGKYNTLAPLTEATQWLNEFGGGNQYNRAGSGINTETGLPEKDALKAFMFDWNPAKIQHVAESYGGGRLKFWRQTFSAAYNAVSPDGEVKEWDIPLFYRYLGSAKSENPMTNYYNASRIVDDYKYQLGILKKDDIQEFTNQLKTNSFMNELTYLVKSTKKRIDYFEDLNEKVTDKNKLSAINDSIQSSVVSFNKKLGTLENKYKVNIDKP